MSHLSSPSFIHVIARNISFDTDEQNDEHRRDGTEQGQSSSAPSGWALRNTIPRAASSPSKLPKLDLVSLFYAHILHVVQMFIVFCFFSELLLHSFTILNSFGTQDVHT